LHTAPLASRCEAADGLTGDWGGLRIPLVNEPTNAGGAKGEPRPRFAEFKDCVEKLHRRICREIIVHHKPPFSTNSHNEMNRNHNIKQIDPSLSIRRLFQHNPPNSAVPCGGG
jgi:hypothetical protein